MPRANIVARRFFLVLLALAAASTGLSAAELFITPSRGGHRPVIAGIAAAGQSVCLTMYHLSDDKVVRALLAARARGVRVRVILDQSALKESRYLRPCRKLLAGGVEVRKSSPRFSLTHAKAMLVDGRRAFVMSLNLAGGAASMRDYGVITEDPAIAAGLAQLFETDWANAENGTGNSPAVSDPRLVVSPVNSEARLEGLIDSADRELIATVENLGDPVIQEALLRAAGRGVAVRLIVPMCDLNDDPLRDYPFLDSLRRGGVRARVMPYPATPRQPYMHAKMMVADGRSAYVGSVNYSVNSTTLARELGLLFSEPELISALAATFARDWQAAVDVPAPPPSYCPGPAAPRSPRGRSRAWRR
jgi:phosphatidylserine/phosphatidylglycerophosphate/cardiolipin synthase-like enzyme